MLAREVAVAVDEGVLDAGVDHRADLDRPCPVLGLDRLFQRADVREVHGGEASLPDPCGAAGVVAEAVHALEQPGAEVEALPVLKQGGSGVDGEPLLAVDAEGHREPVRQVDEALVVDDPALHLVDQTVEDAGGVGAGIVDAVGASFGGAATGGEIAVADRAQALA